MGRFTQIWITGERGNHRFLFLLTPSHFTTCSWATSIFSQGPHLSSSGRESKREAAHITSFSSFTVLGARVLKIAAVAWICCFFFFCWNLWWPPILNQTQSRWCLLVWEYGTVKHHLLKVMWRSLMYLLWAAILTVKLYRLFLFFFLLKNFVCER